MEEALLKIDKFINVGWGSKATQFHGSLGKSAAASTSHTSLSHPTDDGTPHITFRGDGSFFAVSSLDPYESGHARRQVRIYSRDPSAGFIPKLSATSESLPGLESSIAWRPSGNIISGLVRYGYEGGADGKEGRWEVAMLERNGLRHGGFELREKRDTWESGRVKKIEWNCDSDILAIWIERPEGDTGGSEMYNRTDESPTLDNEELSLLSQARDYRSHKGVQMASRKPYDHLHLDEKYVW